MKKFICCFLVIVCIVLVSKFEYKTYSLFRIEKSVDGTISVPEKNFCLSNGFNKLSDCMLVMENYSGSISEAKTFISSKGKATFTKTAPTNTYAEVNKEIVSSADSWVVSSSAHYTLSTSYRFDSNSGKFVIGEYDSSGNFSTSKLNDVLSDKYINYFTCGATETTRENCPTMFQIKDYRIDKEDGVTYYRITKAVEYSFDVVNSFDSEVGLYAEEDDDGTSYFYRGNVSNNFVSYAGYIWKIIRRNGDGSVRMIYNGLSTDSRVSDTSIALYSYNDNASDPAYVGYMYNKNFARSDNGNSTITFTRFKENTIYYFGSGYSFDEETKMFYLTGTKTSGIWGEKHEDIISKYPYTCFSTEIDGQCYFITKAVEYRDDPSKMRCKIYSYSSTDPVKAREPVFNSDIKNIVDKWYEDNILNKKDSNSKLLSNYLSDSVFCNDRVLTSGDGFTLTKNSYYAGDGRLEDRTPILTCSQNTDRFTMSTSNGNGALKYPVALITIDEVMMAGGLLSNVNSSYYLHTDQDYWTMTPTYYGYSYIYGRVASVGYSGELQRSKALTNDYGIRPVINLKNTVVIKSGDGSPERPYVVSLS